MTILKSAKVVDTMETKNVSTNILAEKMVGKKIIRLKAKKPKKLKKI